MNTQNTPVHVNLWHKDFWVLSFADMLLAVVMYMQLPLLPGWMTAGYGATPMQVGAAMGMVGVGVFFLGSLCSYWVQHYRRNHVCLWAVFAMLLSLGTLYWWHTRCPGHSLGIYVVLAVRFVLGATYGLAQMVLSSTLIIDKCESFRRTEANHTTAWFSRLALSIGPAATILLLPYLGFEKVMLVACGCCLLAMLLIMSVKFPFKAPEENLHTFSLDRFFLPRGKWLFVNLLPVATVMGLMFTVGCSYMFYVMLMVGFFFALLAQRFVFVNAELKSEITTGLLLMGVSVLLLISGEWRAVHIFCPVFLGCGFGISGARFLLFFINLSDHCRRGTSQSTCFLACEAGVSLGLFIGYAFMQGNLTAVTAVSLTLTAFALAMYLLFTHRWYMTNKSR